jgi:hypothetical protein
MSNLAILGFDAIPTADNASADCWERFYAANANPTIRRVDLGLLIWKILRGSGERGSRLGRSRPMLDCQ